MSGNPAVGKDFNSASFVNFYDFNDINKVIDYVIYLDTHEDKYMEKMTEPWLSGGIPEENKIESIKKNSL